MKVSSNVVGGQVLIHQISFYFLFFINHHKTKVFSPRSLKISIETNKQKGMNLLYQCFKERAKRERNCIKTFQSLFTNKVSFFGILVKKQKGFSEEASTLSFDQKACVYRVDVE